MKKFTSLLLTMTLILAMAVNVSATQVITFEDNTATVEVTEASDEASADNETADTAATEDASADGEVKGYLALGSDLTQDQLNTVLGLLGISLTDLGNYKVVYTTNADEHNYLDKYLDSALIGKRSLSSVLVTPAEEGHGVVVSTQNVNYCTTNMYRNALITAGVQDADIKVAAPTQISGTAALIGAIKAYEDMSGTVVSDTTLDTALNELVTTGEISESVGDNEEAEELISYVKAQIAANDLDTAEEIEAVIRQGMKDFNVTLTDEEIEETVNLMLKIKAMGIDFSVLADQAEDIYAKYKDQIDAGTFRIEDVSLEDLGIGKIISKSVGNFFTGIANGVKSFFGGLFNKK